MTVIGGEGTRSRRPVVRNTASPGQARTVSAASRMPATVSQDGSACQAGGRSTSRGTPASMAASAAFAVMIVGERVRRVDEVGDAFFAQEGGQAVRAAEPSGAHRAVGKARLRLRPAREDSTSVPAARRRRPVPAPRRYRRG